MHGLLRTRQMGATFVLSDSLCGINHGANKAFDRLYSPSITSAMFWDLLSPLIYFRPGMMFDDMQLFCHMMRRIIDELMGGPNSDNRLFNWTIIVVYMLSDACNYDFTVYGELAACVFAQLKRITPDVTLVLADPEVFLKNKYYLREFVLLTSSWPPGACGRGSSSSS